MRSAAGGRQTFDEELSEGNEAENIRRKHCVDVLILYIANDVGAVGAAGVVNCRRWFQKDEIKIAAGVSKAYRGCRHCGGSAVLWSTAQTPGLDLSRRAARWRSVRLAVRQRTCALRSQPLRLAPADRFGARGGPGLSPPKMIRIYASNYRP